MPGARTRWRLVSGSPQLLARPSRSRPDVSPRRFFCDFAASPLGQLNHETTRKKNVHACGVRPQEVLMVTHFEGTFPCSGHTRKPERTRARDYRLRKGTPIPGAPCLKFFVRYGASVFTGWPVTRVQSM